ncbi:MAG: S8 family serine peptidase [bacterium]
MKRFPFSCLVVFVLVCATNLSAQKEVESQEKYWVFFRDKEDPHLSKTSMIQAAKNNISPRALKRRRKVRPAVKLIDEHDLPVSKNYLNTLAKMGHKPVVISNWLNGASFWLSDSEKNDIEKLPFVKKIQRVGSSNLKPEPVDIKPIYPKRLQKPGIHSLDYGASFLQNDLINVPAVHDLGITGRGIWIGMLDTGFKYKDHEAFQSLEVIAEYDFIHDDGITENQAGQDHPAQHNHGTRTLSTVGGFQEGQLIGPAFDASFLLAKTEILEQEIPVEEDFWAAGIEWLENQGVDVVSSSLGYLDFYNRSDMDGNTAVTTVAADLAVSRGVVVVNSAGNERQSFWHIIIAPADGDSVIAVGAITAQGTLASFSSVGPTADGRTKPDVVALGVSVRTASPSSDKQTSPFGFSSGTSFSCPLTAGVAALILSAHPDLTPIEVREALRMTANRAANPDTLFGWGLVNAYEAILYHGIVFSNLPEVSVNNNGNYEISIKIASKFGVNPSKVSLFYAKSSDNFDHEIPMFQGPEQNQFVATIPEPVGQDAIRFFFSAMDSSGEVTVHPFNAPDSSFDVSDIIVLVDTDLGNIPSSFDLAQNYPNPFNPATKIEYELPVASRVSLTVYNLLGQKVRLLVAETTQAAGRHTVAWDGTDDSGRPVSAGVYFYQLKANNFTKVKKMLIVR